MSYTIMPGAIPDLQYVIRPDGKRISVVRLRDGELELSMKPDPLPDEVLQELRRRFKLLFDSPEDRRDDIIRAFPKIKFKMDTHSWEEESMGKPEPPDPYQLFS